jgi:5S rRNA maturation endonuclease (ribonuclease M5)
VTSGHYPELLAYCRKRGFTDETLNAWKVSTAGPKALRWPLFASDGERWVMANARLRRVIDRETAETKNWFEVSGGPTGLAIGNHLLGMLPGGQNRPSWLAEWLGGIETPDQDKTPQNGDLGPLARLTKKYEVKRVLIVEGEIDCLSAYQVGIPNVLSLPNGASHVDLSSLLRYCPDEVEVLVATDMDEAGDRAAEAIFSQAGRAKRLRLPHKDLNEWLMTKPGLTAEEVLETVSDEKTFDWHARKWISLAQPPPPEKLPTGVVCETPWPRLTARLGGGWKGGQTTGLIAPSGTGKSTWANNVIAHAVMKQKKVGVVALESTPYEVHVKLAEQVMRWGSHHDHEEPERFLRFVTLSELNGKVHWRETIDDLEKMAEEECKLLVMDNWDHILPPGGEGCNEKMKAYAEVQRICKLHDCHALVIWQPSKVKPGSVIDSGNQKGYSQAYQDADNYINMNKFGLARRLEVEKSRAEERPDTTSVIWMQYDLDTRNLHEAVSQADLTLLAPPANSEPPIME